VRWQPIPLVGGSNPDDAEPFSSQEYVNWLPTPAEMPGGRSDWMLKGAPGLQPFVTIADQDRWRQTRNVEGRFFGVCGQRFVQVNPGGDYDVLGTVPGVSRCTITHNQIANGNEVFIGNGSSGFVWNTVTETFTTITDEGFPGALVADYINQKIVYLEPLRRFIGCSELADALNHNTLRRIQAEASPDRLRSIIVDHRELWAMGERTVEVFMDAGTTPVPFINKQITIEQGCIATHSVCKLDNSVFWLSNNGKVYRANGYSPQRISTRAMEQKIARCDMEKAYAFVWEDRGYAVYYLTFPDGETWGYDCAASARAGFPVWHKRRSEGMDRWRLSTLTEWNGAWYGGEFNSGRLMRLDWDYVKEGSDDLVSIWRPGVLHSEQGRVRLHGVELVFDTGHITSREAVLISPAHADASEGATATHQYVQTGGTAPGTFSITAGSLPAGRSMNSSGLVSGTYTTGGTYAYTVQFTDANGEIGTLDEEVIVEYKYPILLSGASRWSGTLVAPTAWTDHALFVDDDANGTPMAAASTTGRFLCATSDEADTTPQLYEFKNGTYNLLTITGTALPAHLSVCFSPDEEWVFFTTAGDLYAYQWNGTGFTHRKTHATGLPTVHGSIACSSDFRIARGSSTKRVSAGQEERNLDWHPGGRFLAGGNATGGTSVYDTNSYPMSAVNDASNSTSGVFWSAAGGHLYTVQQTGPVRCYTWNGTALASVATVSFANALAAASINSARTYLACRGTANEIRLFALDGATITDSGNLDTAGTNPTGMALLTNLTNGLPS
jgi:hypothetical protein